MGPGARGRCGHAPGAKGFGERSRSPTPLGREAIRFQGRRADDLRVCWLKPPRPDWMGRRDYDQLPHALHLRAVRVLVRRPGFRVKRLVLVTTLLDAAAVSGADLAGLSRRRWQAELLFELWKSDGLRDESRGEQPYRVLCEVYAKLLGMVVQHWLLLATGGSAFGSQSRRKAARAVRRQVGHVAAVLRRAGELLRALEVMAGMVAAAGAVNRRKARPSTFQTLFDPDHDGLASSQNEGSKRARAGAGP